jgi:methionyl-tRNA formyltransferase
VAELAREAGVPLFQPERIDEILPELTALAPDFLVVVAYGQLLRPAVLDLPRYVCLNVHGSLLPAYRGASPVQAALLAGETETGVSYMRLTPPMDAGPVYAVEQMPIAPSETAGQLLVRLAALGAAELPRVLLGVARGELQPTEQDDSAATYCKKIAKTDGIINWQAESAEQIWRKYRAYTPWPGVQTLYRGQVLKLAELAGTVPAEGKRAGEAYLTEDGRLAIAAADGQGVVANTLQLPGKRALPAVDFLLGQSELLGQILG